MKIYISGKIAGDSGYKEKFARAAAQLERLGATVINPATAPEEYKQAMCADVMVRCAAIALGVSAERLRELAEADKAERVVVLPCKVGDTLWVAGSDNVPREMELEAPDIRAVCTDEDNLCMSTCNRKPDGFCAYRLRNDGASIGKTVFLTREEAEKALEAKRDVCP